MRDAIEDASTNEKQFDKALEFIADTRRLAADFLGTDIGGNFAYRPDFKWSQCRCQWSRLESRATKLCVIWTIIRLTSIRGSILNEGS